eukprot:scaffold166319_cov13-Tisochrysis_lutea.AAC.1
MLDPASPFAASLRAYIKAQADPTNVHLRQASEGALSTLLDECTAAVLSQLLLAAPTTAVSNSNNGGVDGSADASLQGRQQGACRSSGAPAGEGASASQASKVALAVETLLHAAQELAAKPMVLPHPGVCSRNCVYKHWLGMVTTSREAPCMRCALMLGATHLQAQ